MESSGFSILFEKLDEAKKEQNTEFVYCLNESVSANEIISLFKEYQESLIQSSYTTLTKA